MTETEWRTAADPDHLFHHLGSEISLRKALLLGVASRRRLTLWRWFRHSQTATDTAELRADGLVGAGELQAAYRAVYDAREAAGRTILSDPITTEPDEGSAGYYAIEAAVTLLDPNHSALHVAAVTLWTCRQAIFFGDQSTDRVAIQVERATQCHLLRDVFGNPFRPVAFDPSWRTEAAVLISRGMYDSRDFSAMPILADALQDAGCDNDDILNHCRDANGIHVRGCWVVDLVLGKN